MICPYCGKENPESRSLCDFCGGRLIESQEGEPPVTSYLEPVPESDTSPEITEEQADQPETQSEMEPLAHGDVPAGPAMQYELDKDELPEIPPREKKKGCEKYLWWLIGCFVVLCLILSCGTLYWGFYNFSPALDFLKPPTPTPSLLFSDDFSNPNSGWPVIHEADYQDEYYNNAYRMVENLDNTTSWAYPGDHSFTDVSTRVEATKNGGPDENDMGVMCRYQDDDHFYFGLITSDGYYGIIKMTNGEFTVIGGEYLETSDLINLGDATNLIRFDCIGDVLTLYVNGTQVDQQIDADYTQGNVGLIIGTYDTPGADILFDNFSVQQP